MKESIAIAKDADRKKESSPTRSGNSIPRLRNEPERQLGSLRAVIGNILSDGGTPSVDSISTELSGMHTAQRASVLLALQQTHGNRYVQRVVAGIQAKLKVGQPGDMYEQEADRVADAVMRMPEPLVQRQPEEEEELQTKSLAEQITPLVQKQAVEEEEEELQAKELSRQVSEGTPNMEARINALRGGGQPLPASSRAFFEPRFGYDFSQVRIHTGTGADKLGRAMNAKAFTTEQDIFFRQGEYNHSTPNGRELLGHELTHVIQQTGSLRRKMMMGRPDEIAHNVIQQEQIASLLASNKGQIGRQVEDEEPIQTKVSGDLIRQQTKEGEKESLQPKTALLMDKRLRVQKKVLQPLFSVPAGSIQRVFQEVPGTDVGARYERRRNIIEVLMPWSIEEQAILENVYGALRGAVSRRRRWDTESWVDDFRSSLVSYLSEIDHPSAGHGTMQLTNPQGGSDLSLLLNLLIDERRRVDRVSLLTPGGAAEQAEETVPSREESLPTEEPAEIHEEETTTGAETEESPEELPPESTSEGAYPRDIALFSTFLLRSGYIEQVSRILPPTWRNIPDRQLTAQLSERYTEAQLRRRYLDVWGERQAIKARFRMGSIVAAFVIGLIWARQNIREGEWDQVALRTGGTVFTAWAFNRILYARDVSAETLMARKGLEFGRWFGGAARSSRRFNLLAQRFAGTLLLWDISQEILMSGGGGPDIPFDIIYDVDIDDPSTWRDPDQTMLDMGFTIWYRQSCTPSRDQACQHDIYLGMVEGSLIRTILRFLDITPHEAHQIRDNIYRVQGVITEINLLVLSIPLERVSEEANVLVVATGQRSGERVGPRGHFRALEVRPANEAAESLFGSRDNIFLPEYVLHRVEY